MTSSMSLDGTLLLDGPAVARAVRRLAHEVAERHPGLPGVVVVAVREGGIPVARALVSVLAELTHASIATLALDITGHRDDRPRRAMPSCPLAALDRGGSIDVDGRAVILVDDVIHTGRTLRAALDALADCGRPSAVEPLVLIDRGHRELPLRATYVGRNLPIGAQQWVDVVLDATGSRAPGAHLVARSAGCGGVA